MSQNILRKKGFTKNLYKRNFQVIFYSSIFIAHFFYKKCVILRSIFDWNFCIGKLTVFSMTNCELSPAFEHFPEACHFACCLSLLLSVTRSQYHWKHNGSKKNLLNYLPLYIIAERLKIKICKI